MFVIGNADPNGVNFDEKTGLLNLKVNGEKGEDVTRQLNPMAMFPLYSKQVGEGTTSVLVMQLWCQARSFYIPFYAFLQTTAASRTAFLENIVKTYVLG